MTLLTPRLELVPITLSFVDADLHRRDELPGLLHAEIAEGWPPPLIDVAAMQRIKEALSTQPASGVFTAYYWITREPRVLIGLGGFKSCPTAGAVEIGYTVVPAFQGRGFATEAITALVAAAFGEGVECVFADTLPELAASQRVLLKCAFKPAPSPDADVLRFERRRS